MFGFIEVTEKNTSSKTIVNINDIIAMIEDGSHAAISLHDIEYPLITRESYNTVKEHIQNAITATWNRY